MEDRKRKLMVVDDSLTIRMQIKSLLEERGYQVIEAEDGETCLEILKHEIPDIILLDIVMPGISGLGVCKAIKSSSTVKDISILMLTHVSDTENIVAGLNLGADDYVTKPFIIEELDARISAVLRTKFLQEELRVLSITDPLTGSYNRGYLTEYLSKEIKRAIRGKHALSLILCDIDHFKMVNDTYGHQIGDQVLKGFVQCIQHMFRDKIDWIARYGGEEFIVILPETDIEGAYSFAERARNAIAQMVIESNDKEISVTASFGVTGFDRDTSEEKILMEAMIKEADKCLYQAKQGGRNRVMVGQL
ncbi:MAG: diguanylate cyclase [Thermodesulfobacteriota bacterium]|nr:diguanylate cyclase [Thermodesulfobacteriota bacterium]